MRALVLHWGRTGGGPRFAVDAVDALSAVGVWTAYSSSTHSERADSDARVGDARLALPTFAGAVGFAVGAPRALGNGRALRAFVSKERIDCVFAAMEQVWQPAAAAALRGTGVPYLLGVHDGAFHLGEESRVRAATRRLELAGTDGVLTFSRSATRTFVESVDFPISRIWTSFLPARARPLDRAASRSSEPGRDESFRFGFFGRLLPYKGLDLLVQAVRILRSMTALPFEVEIWGSGEVPALEADDLPPEIRVIRRWVDEDEIERVIGRFDVVVAPYVDASQSGVIPLAGAMGVSSIITPVGGLVEQVSDGITGLVAHDVRADSFAHTMLRMIDTPDLSRRLGDSAAAAARAERSLPEFGRDLEAAMEQLVVFGKRSRG